MPPVLLNRCLKDQISAVTVHFTSYVSQGYLFCATYWRVKKRQEIPTLQGGVKGGLGPSLRTPKAVAFSHNVVCELIGSSLSLYVVGFATEGVTATHKRVSNSTTPKKNSIQDFRKGG